MTEQATGQIIPSKKNSMKLIRNNNTLKVTNIKLTAIVLLYSTNIEIFKHC